jgi:hypothetical protein
MLTEETKTMPPDVATVDRLSTEFNRCFETFEADEATFAPDALFDLLPPFWRFQVQGPSAFATQLRSIADGDVTSRILRTVPTATGFVLEQEETTRGNETMIARRLWLCEVHEGRITEVLGYCNGGWDDALRARQAAEAPMVRS